jgi:hypothetical protein
LQQTKELDIRTVDILLTIRLGGEAKDITGAGNRLGVTNRDKESRESCKELQHPCSTLRALSTLSPSADKQIIGSNSGASSLQSLVRLIGII